MSLTTKEIGALVTHVAELSSLFNVADEKEMLQRYLSSQILDEIIHNNESNYERMDLLCLKIVLNKNREFYTGLAEYMLDKSQKYKEMYEILMGATSFSRSSENRKEPTWSTELLGSSIFNNSTLGVCDVKPNIMSLSKQLDEIKEQAAQFSRGSISQDISTDLSLSDSISSFQRNEEILQSIANQNVTILQLLNTSQVKGTRYKRDHFFLPVSNKEEYDKLVENLKSETYRTSVLEILDTYAGDCLQDTIKRLTNRLISRNFQLCFNRTGVKGKIAFRADLGPLVVDVALRAHPGITLNDVEDKIYRHLKDAGDRCLRSTPLKIKKRKLMICDDV